MRLEYCEHGILIKENFTNRIGMIIGITENKQVKPEVVPKVEWSDGEVAGIHHTNIEPLRKCVR